MEDPTYSLLCRWENLCDEEVDRVKNVLWSMWRERLTRDYGLNRDQFWLQVASQTTGSGCFAGIDVHVLTHPSAYLEVTVRPDLSCVLYLNMSAPGWDPFKSKQDYETYVGPLPEDWTGDNWWLEKDEKDWYDRTGN